MSTNVPVVQNERTPAPLGAYQIEGMEDLQSNDFAIPRWSIIQPTSRKAGADEHIGQFMRNIDGAFAPNLNVVILRISPNRLLWSGDQSDNKPECSSRDGLNGSTYGACNACHFNPQVNHELWNDRSLKMCGYGYNLIVCDEEGGLAIIGAMGTSVRPIKTLNAQFASKARPPFSALVNFSTVKTTNDRGKFYVLQPNLSRWLDPTETAEFRQRYVSIRGATVKDIDEDDSPVNDSPNF